MTIVIVSVYRKDQSIVAFLKADPSVDITVPYSDSLSELEAFREAARSLLVSLGYAVDPFSLSSQVWKSDQLSGVYCGREFIYFEG